MRRRLHDLVRELTASGRPLREELAARGPDVLRGDWLAALDGVPELVQSWADRVGVPRSAINGSTFSCILPGHTHCTAELWLDDHGVFVYCCDPPDPDGRAAWALTEAWLAARIGKTQPLSRTLLPRIKRWMLWELTFITPPKVHLAPLSQPVSEDESRTYEFINIWLRIRRLADEPGEGVPLAATVMAPLAGVSEQQFARTRRRMAREGILVEAGRVGRAKLWLPGLPL